MGKPDNKIKCPNCGEEIDVNELLYHQLEDELKKKFDDKLSKERRQFEEKSLSLQKEKEEIEKSITSGIQEGIKAERNKMEAQLRAKIEYEQSEQFKLMQNELNQKSDQLKEFNKAKSDIERLKREKDELKSSIEAESEKKLNERLIEETNKIKKNEEGKMQFKLSEKEQLIAQLTNQLQEAQRKAAQGSMKMQGEVQELAIEEWLKDQFPLDTIEEIKSGARGADCIQVVNTTTHQNCGLIYYESKRTKSFQPSWIEKFKSDIQEKNANIGVLVTEVMPPDMERMGIKDSIWICTFDEFKGLCFVLRESLIQLSNAIVTQENKGDKMSMLYDYLTSNEFRLQIEAIVEGFTQMHTDLESEKRSMQGIWKKREKQIQKVLLNTTYLYSSVKGIAGNAIQTVKQLELPADEEGDE